MQLCALRDARSLCRADTTCSAGNRSCRNLPAWLILGKRDLMGLELSQGDGAGRYDHARYEEGHKQIAPGGLMGRWRRFAKSPLACPWDVPEMSFGCPLNMPWTSLGCLLGVPWMSFGPPVDVFWTSLCMSLGCSLGCPLQFPVGGFLE